ncbi:ABC transporter substrate-binding protein [Neolewinella persica]|uniref:ABC transporter substrate-binding protein n=1 Tax=Neolewinella persica TaxID=70998 RepID=UPI000364BE8E|nr:ABC transporter substrate-binding protein [Neolewinella persica]
MNFRFFLCLLMAVAFSACKPDPKGSVQTQEDDTSSIVFKHTDNTLRIAARVEPAGLNPVLTTQASARHVRELIFQTLNSIDPETFEQIPLLASVPDIRKEPGGGVSYSYLIDERATWPNGLPVTAADVVFSLKAVMNPLVEAGPYRTYLYNISNIVTSPNNERRFRVVMDKPYILAQQSIGSTAVYPEYAYDPDRLLRNVSLSDLTNQKKAEQMAETNENLKNFATAFNDVALATEPDKIIGSGPYQLEEWNAGQRLTLKLRENYWATNDRSTMLMAKPEKIVFDFIADGNTMTNALRDELVDVAMDLGVDQFKEVRDDEYLNQRFDFATVNSINFFGILFNQQNPLLRDAKTRRALAHLVDVDVLIEQLLPGLATRVNGPVLSGKSYYADLPAIEYDPAKAETLLKEAGWADTNGDGTIDKEIDGSRQEMSMQFLVFPSPTSASVGALVAEWAKEVGIDIEVVQQAPATLYGELDKGNFAMSLLGMGMDPNPDEFTQVWASTSVPPNGSNRSGFANKEADQLIKQIAGTMNASDRDPLYRRFQEIIYENQPMVFLFSPATRLVVSKRLKYSTTSLAPGLDFNAIEAKNSK